MGLQFLKGECSGKEHVQKFTELFDVLPLFVQIIKNRLPLKSSLEGTRKSTRISESIMGMKIGSFVSYIKWLGELGSVGCVHSVFCTVCMFDPARPFFPKWYASYYPWNLSFFLLARVCYTADCNVLMLR